MVYVLPLQSALSGLPMYWLRSPDAAEAEAAADGAASLAAALGAAADAAADADGDEPELEQATARIATIPRPNPRLSVPLVHANGPSSRSTLLLLHFDPAEPMPLPCDRGWVGVLGWPTSIARVRALRSCAPTAPSVRPPLQV